jgi:threonine dehydratase
MPTAAERDIPGLSEIHQAHERIRGLIRRTPVVNDSALDEYLGCELHCKLENLQRMGAFKFRGASNAVMVLEEEEREGDVATHSSGNHGAALALAASIAGRMAHVVMPDNSSGMKISAVKDFGGIVHLCESTHEARRAGLQALVTEGKISVHPYDNRYIIAGQGTAALELDQDVPGLDQVITPLGGGGLVSGTALALRDRGIDVFAVEPEGAAETVASLEQGRIVRDIRTATIADGLRAIVGERDFLVIRRHVAKVLTVSDDDIRAMMALFWRKLKMVIEPSSATVLAAVRNHPEIFSGRRVGAIITGGNIHPRDWVALTGEAAP